MDRGGRPYGSYLDRQSNPVANQGGVYAGADYDVGAKIAIQMENASICASAYGGADNEQVWDIAPDDLLFTVPGKHGSTGDIKMAVLPCLNGMGAVATARYAAEPNGLMMIKEAVKNQIVYVGAAFQALSSARGNVEHGISVQLGGLKTLRMGNNQFGDDRGDTNYIKPGDLVCVDVPMPGRAGLQPGIGMGMRPKAGVPANKYTLQLRRYSTHSAGRSLRLHIREILRDPKKWKVAMGEHVAGTKAWATAAHYVTQSYLTAGVLMVRELMATGVLVPSDAGILIGADGAADVFRTARQVANGANGVFATNIPDVDKPVAYVNSAADSFALHLAQIYGLVPKSRQDLTKSVSAMRAPGNPARAFAGRVLRLPGYTLNRIFYDGTNRAFEFGYDAAGGANGLPSSSARFPNSGVVDDDTPSGRFLLEQLNHFPKAVSGMHTSIQKDLAFLVGKATTGASGFGSGNAHVFLGMNRQ